MHGSIHWNELNTHDVEKAKAYHTKTFGWTFETVPMEEGAYHVAWLDGEMVAGVFDLSLIPEMADMTAHWLTYLAVDDVEATVQKTKDQGGQVYRAPWDVPGVGRIAILAEPSGAGFGVMKPEPG